MTAAVILTIPIQDAQIHMFNKTKIIELISEIKPFFSEIIVISDHPSSYLPYVKDRARILTPYQKRNGLLSSLYTALSLTKSEDVWILHEAMKFPGIHLFSELKALKDKKNSPAVIFDEKYKNSFLYSMFDKRVLKHLNNIVANSKTHVDLFLNQINYTQAAISDHL
ncbi:hypothetical protein [Fictibacillus barbaricus]|uniref:Molybdopterin-guanine dinucleotide biosynthesis protein A n=1 Tax=Fictibacillus barbaricus TaxID=182136 RepID=A0ABU1U2Q3_9BACL|nr:hypothetical protein [Fictibacillus barbaricus]MDR7073740.1 molybdopterin-guanine dinucleotide biosynthesis protein A [Fictibacillus barbaricus]